MGDGMYDLFIAYSLLYHLIVFCVWRSWGSGGPFASAHYDAYTTPHATWSDPRFPSYGGTCIFWVLATLKVGSSSAELMLCGVPYTALCRKRCAV